MQPQPTPVSLSTWEEWAFPLLVFCLGIFFLTYIVRRIVENYLTKFAERNQWKKVWLPSLPVIWGAAAGAIMHGYPYLKTLPTWGTRAIYGAVAGGLCNFIYKVIKAVVKAKFGVSISESEAPPSGDIAEKPVTVPKTDALPVIQHTEPPK